MLEIGWGEDGKIRIAGRLDASEAGRVEAFLDDVTSTKDLDLSGLQYISSLGLGVLLKTQKRLKAAGQSLRLVGMPPHIHDIFHFSGFDRVFDIECRERRQLASEPREAGRLLGGPAADLPC